MPKRAHVPREEKAENTPRVGIFFVVGPKLWIDLTPLPQAGIYGEFTIHERGHDEYWAQLIRQGSVPPDSEYEEYPRGRVAFNGRTHQFSVLADRCILREKDKALQIMDRMRLPADRTTTGTDPHYRCARCLKRGE